MGRHPFRTAGLVVAGVLVLALAAVVGVFFYLRSYAPLDASPRGYAPGPGLGADVEPTFGSGGKPVFIPGYKKGRPFDTAFTLHNDGRFPVTVTGLADRARAGASLGPRNLLVTDSASASAEPGHLHRFHKLRLDAGDSAILVVRWGLDCEAGSAAQSAADSVRLRYSYLSVFERTQTVRLPFAVTLRCVGGPPANP
jgi:hypothetical protein